MKTKKDKNYSFNHVKERLNERFGLSMSRELFDGLSDAFDNTKSHMILKENEDQEIHQIILKGQKVTFVYSISRGYITTAMNWG